MLLKSAQYAFTQSLSFISLDHVGTVIAQEHVVGNHVGTNLQFQQRLCLDSLQRSAVTATIDSTADDGRFALGACQSDGYLFGIRTEVVKGFRRGHAIGNGIVEVAIDIMAYQIGIVGIGIGAVTTAIDITLDAGIHANGIAAIDTSSDVVTAIDVVDVSATYNHTCREACRELVLWIALFIHIMQLNLTGQHIGAISHRTDIGHTAAAIDIINLDGGVRPDFQQQAFWACHSTLITTTIEIPDFSCLEVPRWTNGHISLIVTAKHATYLEG